MIPVIFRSSSPAAVYWGLSLSWTRLTLLDLALGDEFVADMYVSFAVPELARSPY